MNIRYSNPFRPCYEMISALAWGSIFFATVILSIVPGGLPRGPMLVIAALALIPGLWMWRRAWRNLRIKAGLSASRYLTITVDDIIRIARANPGKILLGKGFEVKPRHTQLWYEMLKVDPEEVAVPALLERFMRSDLRDGMQGKRVGKAWLHGIEPDEKVVFMPRDALEGMTFAPGTTGAGKTTLLILQSVYRSAQNDTVIVIDPKGVEEGVIDLWRSACKKLGRPFVYFHLGHPERSVRINPLKNYIERSDLASRITSLVVTESDFKKFGWMELAKFTSAFIELEERPTLMSLQRAFQLGVNELLERLLSRHFDNHLQDWGARLQSYASDKKTRLDSMIEMYLKVVAAHHQSSVIENLLSTFRHDREHYQKMVLSILPVLQMLTAGETGRLISPDPDDLDDPREIWDCERMIRQKAFVYIGLSTLSNNTVGAAIGSMLLSDITAVAGARYNYEGNRDSVAVLVDEAYEVINEPTLQLLNKGRGAGFDVTLFAQTVPDFAARLGNENSAYQFLGNLNNVISMRVIDEKSQKYVGARLGMVPVQRIEMSRNTGTSTEENVIHFRGGVSYSLKEKEAERFPVTELQSLPNLHFIANIAGGTLIKGRLPAVVG